MLSSVPGSGSSFVELGSKNLSKILMMSTFSGWGEGDITVLNKGKDTAITVIEIFLLGEIIRAIVQSDPLVTVFIFKVSVVIRY